MINCTNIESWCDSAHGAWLNKVEVDLDLYWYKYSNCFIVMANVCDFCYELGLDAEVLKEAENKINADFPRLYNSQQEANDFLVKYFDYIEIFETILDNY